MRCMEYVKYSERDPHAALYPLITCLLTKEISSVTQNIILYMILLI